MTNQPEVIVVGAGVMGCGTAYWLSKAGYKVLVLEQEAIACGASGVAAAMLEAVGHGAHLAANDPLTAFARAGLSCIRHSSLCCWKNRGWILAIAKTRSSIPPLRLLRRRPCKRMPWS